MILRCTPATRKRKDINASITAHILACTRRDSTTLQSYLFAAIDELKGGCDREHEFHHSSITDIPGDATFAIRIMRGTGILVENTCRICASPCMFVPAVR